MSGAATYCFIRPIWTIRITPATCRAVMTALRGRNYRAPDGNPESVLRMNRASTRVEAVAAFLEEVSRERADLILLAGDFNEPSHLDWTDATCGMWDHNGCVVPWDCSVPAL